ncbi:hypothetical protein PSY28_23175, partial [Shigella flexneri]|nr:hypothetical protein [Shigella flexneri]MDD0197439.1 hypothetical protein [Shigella flexneri]
SSALSKVLSKIDDTSAELLTDDISDLKNNNDITAENNNIYKAAKDVTTSLSKVLKNINKD